MTQFAAIPALVNGRALYLPTSSSLHGTPEPFVCHTIVTGEGDQCMKRFADREKWLRHTAGCAQQHASAIHAYRHRTHPDIMRPWDPELESFITKHRRAILDGSKRI